MLPTPDTDAAAPLTIDIVRLTSVIGAEVRNIDLGRALDSPTVKEIRKAWYDYAVLLFRSQTLSENDQVRFGRFFGELSTVLNRRGTVKERHPSVMFISNVREDGELIGSLPDGEVFFHSDHCFTANPPAGTMLYAMEIPSFGGNTIFSNMYAAYDALPDDLKGRLEGLQALNVYDLAGAPAIRMSSIPPNSQSHIHPVVRIHPITGRRALYVNRLMTYRIEGLPQAEGTELLNYLFDHQERSEFFYEHVWKPGDIIIWDNRCTLHARTNFSSQERRLLRRIVLLNDGISAPEDIANCPA